MRGWEGGGLFNKNSLGLKIGRWMPWAKRVACILVLLVAGLAAVDGGWRLALGRMEPVYAAQTAPVPDCKECESQVNAARKDLEARIDKDRQDAESRIDKAMGLSEWILAVMITVFGFLLPLLGGLAVYFQLKQARRDAEEQVKSLGKKIKKIDEDYRENFPQFSAMDARMQKRLSEMKLHMPSEDDFNEPELFAKMPEMDRQYIQDSELTVAALSVFGLDQSASLRARLLSIYGVFARFHNLRDDHFKNPEEEDFARAVTYAGRVIELDPKSAEGYRMQGAIYLDRYRLLKDELKSTDRHKLEELLTAAETVLDEAIGKCTSSTVDAGAYYNRAMAHFYRGRVEKAVAVSRHLLGLEEKVPLAQREKYLPPIYVNLGSYLARRALDAKAAGQTEDERKFSGEAVQAITKGVRDFERTTMQDGGLERLRKLLLSELVGNEELSQLEAAYFEQLWAMAKKKPEKKDAAVTGTDGKDAGQKSPGAAGGAD